MPLIDWEVITKGLIPPQYLFDGERYNYIL